LVPGGRAEFLVLVARGTVWTDLKVGHYERKADPSPAEVAGSG
jgi:hypothetical protein